MCKGAPGEPRRNPSFSRVGLEQRKVVKQDAFQVFQVLKTNTAGSTGKNVKIRMSNVKET